MTHATDREAIPEPQTGLLLAAGLGFLAWRRLRRI